MSASDRVAMSVAEKGRDDRRSNEDSNVSWLKRVGDEKPSEILQRAKKRAELRLWTVERELGVAESLIAMDTLPNAKKVVDFAQSELDCVRLDAEKENRGDAPNDGHKTLAARWPPSHRLTN